MNYDWETFHTAYQTATDEQKAVIDSDVIPDCVGSVIAARSLDTSQHRTLVKLLSLFTLGVLDEPALLEEFRNLAIPEGRLILGELRACTTNRPVSPLSDNSGEMVTPIINPDKIQAVENDLGTEIAATEAALEATPATLPVRTMASDMAAVTNDTPSQAGETVYTSTQEALLREAKPATQPNATPTPVTAQSQNSQLPTSVHPPRWDSEQ